MANGPLSRDEVAALLAGVADSIKGKDKRNIHDTKIVMVQYGKNSCITHVSVHLFENDGWDTANEYCNKINGLVLAGNEWMRAKIVNENEIERVTEPYQLEMLPFFDKRAIQKIIRSIDRQTLTIALKNIDDNILQIIKQNMSKRSIQMLEDDMEYLGPVRLIDIIRAQKKILDIIRHLEDTGEIVIGRN